MRLRGQDMEGLEDNNIKQTNSCCNKSKKKKVIIIVIAILCVAAVNRLCNNKDSNNA